MVSGPTADAGVKSRAAKTEDSGLWRNKKVESSSKICYRNAMKQLYIFLCQDGIITTRSALNGFKPTELEDKFCDINDTPAGRDILIRVSHTILFIDGRDGSIICLKGSFTMEAVN